jgi:hypothetical protein
MSWSMPRPLDNWSMREVFAFLREIYARPKWNSFTWNPPNVPANSTVDTTLTTSDAEVLTGLRVGMPVSVSPPSTIDSGIVCAGAWVATDDTLTIRLANVTALGVNPASGTWAFHGKVI